MKKNVFNNTILNTKGMNLIEVMMVTAVFGVVLMAVLNIVNLSNQNQKELDQKLASINLTNDIVSALSSTTACTNTVAGTAAFSYDPTMSTTSLSLTNIKNDSNTAIYRTYTDSGSPGKTYYSGLLKINSLTIYQYKPSETPASSTDSKFYSGTAKLKIQYGKMAKTPGVQTFIREITLSISLNNGGGADKTISNCVALGLGGALPSSGGGGGPSTSQWVDVADTTGIYYNKNVFSGGTPTTTTVPFETRVVDNNTNNYSSWSFSDPVFSRIKSTGGSKAEIRSSGKDKGVLFALGTTSDRFRYNPGHNGSGGANMYSQGPYWSFYLDPLNVGLPNTESYRFNFGCYAANPQGFKDNYAIQSTFSVSPVVKQTSTASYNGLLLNMKINSSGSGQRNSIKLQKSGVDYFTINSDGLMLVSDGTGNSIDYYYNPTTFAPMADLEIRKAVDPTFSVNNGNLNAFFSKVISTGSYMGTAGDLGVTNADLRIGASNDSYASMTKPYQIIVSATNGRVGIGNWAAATTFAPAYPLDVVGDVNSSTCFRKGATVIGGTCTSDERLKEEIRDFDLGLDELMKLQPKRYKFNGLGEMPKTGEETVGLIAQDLELIAKEFVSEKEVKLHPKDQKKTLVKTVNYSVMIYIVIDAIKQFYQQFLEEVKTINEKLKILLDLHQQNQTTQQMLTKQYDQLQIDLDKLKEKMSRTK